MLIYQILNNFNKTNKFPIIFRSYKSVERLPKMNIVYFRHNSDTEIENKLNIHFRLTDPTLGIDRDFNFQRNIGDKVEIWLERIKTNIQKELMKRDKKAKRSKLKKDNIEKSDVEIVVELYENEQQINDKSFSDLLPMDGSQSDGKLWLKILNHTYNIFINKPWVRQIVLPKRIMAGCYACPTKFDVEFAERSSCEFQWLKNKQPEARDGWIVISNDFHYHVKDEDVGFYLKFVCVPKNGENIGPAVDCRTTEPICSGVNQPAMISRYTLTSEKLTATNEFRTMSYNLLADLYCDSEYSHTELFGYCSPEYLDIDYRRQLFTREIIDSNSDIICLQELDEKVYKFDLEPILNGFGLKSVFTRKGNTAEGLGTFYNSEKFELIENNILTIGENINKFEAFQKLWNQIKDNKPLIDRLSVRSTTVQVTVLQSKTDSKSILIVANTHLYFHPDADHIRLLQIGFAMLYVEDIYRKIKLNRQNGRGSIGLIFCGDFNSVPECGIYKLLTEKFVPEDFIDYQSNKKEAVSGVTLRQPFDMQSAYQNIPFTNYTPLFSGCLDYIFYEMNCLKVLQTIPVPSEDVLKENQGIPSKTFPSDHVALVADFQWRN